MNYTDVFGAQTVPPSEESYILHNIAGADNQFYWPEQYGGFGYLLADITELVSDGAAAVRLPVADGASVGESFLLRNRCLNDIQVNDASGAPAALLPAGHTLFFYVVDNTPPAGQWQIFTFGTGTSAADAVALAGGGLSVAAGRLQVSSEYRAINSNYPMIPDDRGQILDVVAGTLTVTTPDSATAGAGFYSYIRNSSAGDLTLEGFGSQTVNGALSVSMAPGDSVILLSTGTNWVTVGFGRSVSGQFSEVIVNAAAGDVTLSSSDVAGRMIRVAGTATASITVTLPAIDNIYFVAVESGMGAHVVSFTTGSGATAALNANERTVLNCDGTNVLAAVTTTVTSSLALVDGSATSPSISFSLDTDTGLFRKGNNVLGIAAGGVEVGSFGSAGFVGNVIGNVTGNVTGNAGTVTNGVYTTGNQTIAGVKTFSSPISGSVTGNAATATALQTARTIGGVSFNGTANIDLPGVNTTGNQNTSGNAATVTNGVYTTGDQTIGGTKTFSGTATFSGAVDGPALVNKMFPVGSIYITATATSPASFLGGTWSQIAAGRTLIGVGTLGGDIYAAGDTGGAARVTLGINEIPSHNHGGTTGNQSADHTHSATTSSSGEHTHNVRTYSNVGGSIPASTAILEQPAASGNDQAQYDLPNRALAAGSHTHSVTTGGVSTDHNHSISAQGGGLAHENRMPYLAVYFWQRTA